MNRQKIAQELVAVARELTAARPPRADQWVRNATRQLDKGLRYSKAGDLIHALDQFYLAKSSVDGLVREFEDAAY